MKSLIWALIVVSSSSLRVGISLPKSKVTPRRTIRFAADEGEESIRTLDDDLPQLEMETLLMAGVSKESSAKTEQSTRLEAVQERLARTMELKKRVEGLFEVELKFVSEQLAVEEAAEAARARDISGLMEKFSEALEAKEDALVKDETLLKQMEATLGMVREANIQATMKRAVDGKAALCGIEAELIVEMRRCLEQLRAELAESESRGANMAATRRSLPDPEGGDYDAIRAYSWDEVGRLKDTLVESAESAAAREKSIESIKVAFAAAMDKRRGVLSGSQTTAAVPLSSPTPPPPPSRPRRDGSSSGRRESFSTAASPATPSDLVVDATMGVRQSVGGFVKVAKAAAEEPSIARTSTGVKALFGSGTEAFQAAVSEWERATIGAASGAPGTVRGEGAETADEMQEIDLAATFQEIKKSPTVKAALASGAAASEDVVEGLKGVGAAMTEAIRNGAEEEGQAGENENGLQEALAGIRRTSKALSALLGLLSGGDGGNYILPQSSKKSD